MATQEHKDAPAAESQGAPATENQDTPTAEAIVRAAPAPGAAEAPPAGDLAAAGVAELTPEKLAELEAKASRAEENWDRYVRTLADLENYRKRAARERQEAAQSAVEGLLSRLLPVLDNFEMAAAAINHPTANLEALRTGVAMIQNQLRQVLTEAGLEEVDATGKPFDPNLHEAVSQQETSAAPDGNVLQQVRKGYKLRGRLLRPASVVVARQPAAGTAAQDTASAVGGDGA